MHASCARPPRAKVLVSNCFPPPTRPCVRVTQQGGAGNDEAHGQGLPEAWESSTSAHTRARVCRREGENPASPLPRSPPGLTLSSLISGNRLPLRGKLLLRAGPSPTGCGNSSRQREKEGAERQSEFPHPRPAAPQRPPPGPGGAWPTSPPHKAASVSTSPPGLTGSSGAAPQWAHSDAFSGKYLSFLQPPPRPAGPGLAGSALSGMGQVVQWLEPATSAPVRSTL